MAGGLDRLRASNQALRAERAPAPESQPTTLAENFGAGVSSGVDQTQGMFFGLGAMAGDALGIKALQDWGMEGYKRNQAEAQSFAPRVQSLKDIDSPDDFFDFAAGAIGQSVPSLAVSFGGGAAGAYLGKRMVRKTIEKQVVERAAAKMVAEGIGEEAAKTAIRRQLTNKALKVGGVLGAGAGSWALNTGDLYTELKEAGVKDAPMYAAAGGSVMAALDTVGPAMAINDIVGDKVKDELTKNLGKALLKGAGKYGAVEGLTEGGQEAVALGTRAIADPTFDPKSKESVQRVLDSMAAGAIVGALGGTLAGGAEYFSQRGEKKAEEAPPTRRNFEDPTEDDTDPLFESTSISDSKPTRYIGAVDKTAETLDEIAPFSWEGTDQGGVKPSDAVAKRVLDLQESNPEMSYEAVPVKAGNTYRWAIAEYAPIGGTDNLQFDSETRTRVPTTELVQDSFDQARRAANAVGGAFITSDEILGRLRDGTATDEDRATVAKNRDYENRQRQLTEPFDLIDPDTGETIKAAAPLVLNRLTRMGMRLDQDKSGGMAARARRGLVLALGELMQTPVKVTTTVDGKKVQRRVLVKPTKLFKRQGKRRVIDLQPDKVIYEASGRNGEPATLVTGSGVVQQNPKTGEWAQRGKTTDINAPNSAVYSTPVERAGGQYRPAEPTGIEDEELGVGTTSPINGQFAPRAPDGEVLASYRSGDTVWARDEMGKKEGARTARPERASPTQDPEAMTLQAELQEMQTDDDQARLAGQAANQPETLPNSELGGYAPRATGGAPNTLLTDAELDPEIAKVSAIVNELRQQFGVTEAVEVVNLTSEDVKVLRTKDADIDKMPPKRAAEMRKRKRDVRSRVVSKVKLQQRYGLVHGANVYREIMNALDEGVKGTVINTGRDYVMFVDPTISAKERVEVLAHEFGHIVTEREYNKLPQDLKDELHDAHELDSATRGSNRDFWEWMANQFVAWSARRTAPQGALQKWLKATADTMKKLFDWLRGKYKLDSTFAQFMDGVVGVRAADPFSMYFAALGPAADFTWNGMPVRRNFTPPKDAAAWAKGKIKPWLMQYDAVYRNADGFRKLAMKVWDTFFASQDGIVHRMRGKDGNPIPALKEFWKNFSFRAGEAGGATYHQEVKSQQNRWKKEMRKAFYEIVEDNKTNGETDWAKVKELEQKLVKEMRSWDGNPNAAPTYDPEIAKYAARLRADFDQMLGWAQSTGLPLRKVPNYFPRVFDKSVLIKRKDEFLQILVQHGIGDSLAMYQSIMDEAHLIAFGDQYVDDVSISAAYAAAFQHRELPAKLAAALEEFYVNDLETVTATYAYQMARRVVFHERFGGDMEKHKAAYKEWAFNRDAALAEWQQFGDVRAQLKGINLDDALRREVGDPPRWNPAGKLEDALEEIKGQLPPDQWNTLRKIVDLNLGRVGTDMPVALKRAMSQVLLYQNVRLLAFTIFGALPDLAAPMIRGNGIKKTLRSYVMRSKDADRKALVEKMMQTWGLAMEHFTEHIMVDGVSGDPGMANAYKWSDTFFRWTGVKWYEHYTRGLALSTGIDYLLEAAEKGETAKLEELGLTADDVKAWDKGGRYVAYSKDNDAGQVDQKIQAALIRFMHEAKVSGIDPAQKTMWGADPRFMLLWHLKSYMYEFQHRIMGRIGHQLNSSNMTGEQLRWVMPALMGLALAGFGLELRELIQYSLWGEGDKARTDQMGGPEYLYTLVQRSGFFGLAQYGTDAAEASINGRAPLLTITGPTVGQMNDVLQRPLYKTLPSAIPVINNITSARNALSEELK